MSTGPELAYGFLPYHRIGAITHVTQTSLSGPRPSFDVAITVREGERSESITRTVEIEQVQEFVDISSEVTRTDPAVRMRGTSVRTLATSEFEPNYLPLVEVRSPDLLWRHTPVAPTVVSVDGTTYERLTPWLFLAVLEETEFEPGSMGSIQVQPSSLPDPANAWAWAHVQVIDLPNDDVVINTPESARRILEQHPHLARARMICPRPLRPATRYYAFCLPTYERIRRVGLGLSHDGSGSALIDISGGDLEFRPHFAFEFRTGESGDFESLVTRLYGHRATGDIGIRDVSFAEPGPLVRGIRRSSGASVLGVEGGLKSPETVSTPWSDLGADPFRQDVATLLDASQPGEADDEDDDPLLLPPAFGRAHLPSRRFTDLAAGDWYTTANLDPRIRATANLGYQIVERHWQAILQKAWEWGTPGGYDDLRSALGRLRAAELAKLVSERLFEKHLAQLSVARFLQVTEAMLGRALLPGGGTLRDQLGSRPELGAWLSGPARQLLRGSLGSKWTKPFPIDPSLGTTVRPTLDVTPLSHLLEGVNDGLVSLPPIDDALGGTGVTVTIAGGDRGFTTPVDGGLEGAVGGFEIVVDLDAPGVDVPGLGATERVEVEPRQFEDSLRQGFLEVVPPPIHEPPLEALDLSELAQSLRTRIAPRRAVTAAVAAEYELAGGIDETTRLDRVVAYPEFSTPVSNLVVELSKDLLLPGVGQLPADSVSLLITNPAFVAAVHLGLNEAVGRMLLFNRYPTDARGSYFRRFWNTLRTDDGELPTVSAGGVRLVGTSDFARDVQPIHTWSSDDPLAAQLARGSVEQAVLLVRGEVLRRYPGTVLYAQASNADRSAPTGEHHYPIFAGRFEPDITYVGFDIPRTQIEGSPGVFFIFEQPLSAPRFGLDATPPASVGSWSDLAWDHVDAPTELPVASPADLGIGPSLPKYHEGSETFGPSLRWATDSADVAAILLQAPVRVYIHSAELVGA